MLFVSLTRSHGRYQTELNTMPLESGATLEVEHDQLWDHFESHDKGNGRYIKKSDQREVRNEFKRDED